MRTDRAGELLRRLGAGVRPVGDDEASWSDAIAFARLLDGARSGALSSGRSVRIPDPLGLEVDEETRRELDRAADAAEAAGAGSLLAILPDAQVRIDVPAREASWERPLRDAGEERAEIVTGIDAVVVLIPRESEGGETGARAEGVAPALRRGSGTIGPPGRITSASLWRTLAGSPAPAET